MGNFFRNWFEKREVQQPTSSAKELTKPQTGEPTAKGASYAERVVATRNPQTALTVSAVYRATEMRADTFALMPFQYQRRDREGGNYTTWMYGIGKRINYLLQEEPNPLMTGASLWKQVVINRQQLGNGFVYLERDVFGDLIHLWPAVCGGYNMMNSTYNIMYLSDHGIVEVPMAKPENVLHFPNTFRDRDGFWGISTLRFAFESLTLYKTQKALSLENAAKGGRLKLLIGEEKPSGAQGTWTAAGTFSKSTTQKYADELNESIYQKDVVAIRGLSNVNNITMSQSDMQLAEQLSLGLDDVARFWGTPRPLLMLDTNSHYNDYQNATMEYLQRTIAPEKAAMEKEIFRKIIGQEHYGMRRIHICEKPLLSMDPERQAKVDQLHLQMGWTVNEIRAEHDMPAIDNGNIAYISTNLAELGSDKLRNGTTELKPGNYTVKEPVNEKNDETGK